MKKYIVILIILVGASNLSAQNSFFNDCLRRDLKLFLVSRKDAGYPEAYGYDNLLIRNLLTRKIIEDIPDTLAYGLYSFSALGPHPIKHIFIKNKNDYQIILMNSSSKRGFSEILLDLIHYFDANPEIDQRLLPIFTEAVCQIFMENTKQFQLGTWYDWHTKDEKEYFGQ